jgi:hypothetical protein
VSNEALTHNEQRVNVRIPSALAGQLRVIAIRDANGISATVRTPQRCEGCWRKRSPSSSAVLQQAFSHDW